MEKIFGIDKYKFYLSNVTTSIIYNNENIKDKIINELHKSDFFVIDTKIFDLNIYVKDYLKNFGFDMKLVPFYNLKDILTKRFSDLTFEMQMFVKTIAYICSAKVTIVFDDILTFLNHNQKMLVLKYIKDNNITFINFTSDIDEVLFAKYLIVLSKEGVIIEGITKSVLKEERILKHNGFNLPFVVDLSYQLKDYRLIDQEYYSVEKLVSDLWK